VWEEFSDAPINGWMKDLSCAIPIEGEKDVKIKEEENKISTEVPTL
jgi:hypothetical protein